MRRPIARLLFTFVVAGMVGAELVSCGVAGSAANGADESSACTPSTGGGLNAGGDQCTGTFQGTCGGTMYQATCACPQGTCACFGPSNHVVAFAGCPLCPTETVTDAGVVTRGISASDVFALCAAATPDAVSSSTSPPDSGEAAASAADASVVCLPSGGGGITQADRCEYTANEICAGIPYEVSCSCPAGTCICFGPTTYVVSYPSCPVCPGTGSIRAVDGFALCGFPYGY